MLIMLIGLMTCEAVTVVEISEHLGRMSLCSRFLLVLSALNRRAVCSLCCHQLSPVDSEHSLTSFNFRSSNASQFQHTVYCCSHVETACYKQQSALRGGSRQLR